MEMKKLGLVAFKNFKMAKKKIFSAQVLDSLRLQKSKNCMIYRSPPKVFQKDLLAAKVMILRMRVLWKGVSVEAEHPFIEGSMENWYVILVVEAVTRVAQPKSEMMKIVTEAVEDPMQPIQMQNSITSSKNTENVKLNSWTK